MNDLTTKRCTKCKQKYPPTLEYFARHKGRIGNLDSWCLSCHRDSSRRYREADPEKKRESVRRWRKANPDKARAAVRRWAQNNPDKQRKWRETHLERARELDRIAHKTEQYRAKRRIRRRKNRERENEQARLYAKTHREKARIREGKRRAREYAANGSYTDVDVKRQGEAQHWKCYWRMPGCAIDCRKIYHVDHVIPLSKGGSNGPENIVISCPHCNLSKYNKLPHECTEKLL